MKWDEWIDFPRSRLDAMKAEIARRREAEPALFINPILREDIFDILGRFCTVVYYPLADDEANDGFDVTRPVSYLPEQRAHFVFINTNKPIEKQIFAAAHELGHIWDIPGLIWNGTDADFETRFPRPRYEETAINRFAAELLMPAEHFQPMAKTLIDQHRRENRIRVDDFALVISVLMNTFCVPEKAVLLRLYETRRITEALCRRFIDAAEDGSGQRQFQEDFARRLAGCIEGHGFTRLGVRTRKKGIQDFPQYLNEVEKRDLFSSEKIRTLREKLEIEPVKETQAELDMNGRNTEQGW